MTVKTRTFHRDGREVSEVGLGCWQIGGQWGPIDEGDAMAVLRTAHEQGIDFFDTADVYGEGRSERLIGRFLKETAARPFLATKVGRFPHPGFPGNFEPATVREHVEASLLRLGVDVVDLVQLHCVPREVLERGEMFATLRELRDEGKLRNYGASVESMEEAAVCLRDAGCASLQIIFNVYRQKPIHALFDEAVAKGVAIVVRLPLASGLLAGRYDLKTTFHEQDHRHFNRDGEAFNVGETFAGLPFDVGLRITERLRAKVPTGYSMAQFAQRWVLDHPAVTTLITGARRAEQVVENAAASALEPLPPGLHHELELFYKSEVYDHIRGPY